MGLREEGKARRRSAVLEASETLIRSGGVDALSMRTLASRARVSVATVYNLFGSKEEILCALLDRALSSLLGKMAPPGGAPLELVHSMIAESIEWNIADGELYRPLFRAVDSFGVTPQYAAILERVGHLGVAALTEAARTGALTSDVPATVLVRHVMFSYVHSSRHWARGEMDDAGYRAYPIYCLYLALLSVATEAARPRFLAEMRRLEPNLPDFQPLPLVPQSQTME